MQVELESSWSQHQAGMQNVGWDPRYNSWIGEKCDDDLNLLQGCGSVFRTEGLCSYFRMSLQP